MPYGSLSTVKSKKELTDTTSDAEINAILSDISDLIDWFLDGLETTPITNATKLKAINYVTNTVTHGEFEIRHGNRDKGIALFNLGWSWFDKYLNKTHGITSKELFSAKMQIIAPTWRNEVQSRLLALKHAWPFE